MSGANRTIPRARLHDVAVLGIIWLAGNPSWSPDDSRLVFEKGSGTDGGIFVIDADGSRLARLVADETELVKGVRQSCTCSPPWSPDGTTIAFARFSPGWALYVMHADGSSVRWLYSPDDCSLGEPSWAPDGSSIAVEFDLGVTTVGINEFWAAVRVPGVARHGLNPDWSPDGRSLVFSSYVTYAEKRGAGCGSSWPACRMASCGGSFPNSRSGTTRNMTRPGRAWWSHADPQTA